MKKRSYFLVFLLFSFIILSTGCGGSRSYLSDVKQSGDRIYYVLNDSLYKMNTDWSEKTKLTDKAYRLWAEDKTIFYINDSELCNLYKINTDSTDNTMLGEDEVSSFTVSDDWIYFCTKKSNDEMNELERNTPPDKLISIIIGGVYKMKTDGSERTKLADLDFTSGLIQVSDDWIYYTNNGGLNKMMKDGTGQTRIADDTGLEAVKDNWIYYSADYQHQYLYRIKTDGTEKTQIIEDSTGDFILSGDHIYFTVQGEDGIYRINPDGANKTKMNNVPINEIKGIYGNWIYYTDNKGSGYRISMDGSDKLKFE